MKKIIKRTNMNNPSYNWKKILTISIIIIILLGIITQLIIFYSEKITSEDLKYEFVQWSEYCDGRVYSQEEKETFCNACFNKNGKCEWPLDMNISIGKLKRTLNTNGEIHCFFKIDNINYYTEKGSYYGITETPLFTWQLLDSTKSHTIEFCCGIDRQSVITTLFHLEKNIEQGCITSSIQPRCINETI
ncbi:MAG: hypothetical protein ACP5NZ_03995 [Nanobdellota archaeon]